MAEGSAAQITYQDLLREAGSPEVKRNMVVTAYSKHLREGGAPFEAGSNNGVPSLILASLKRERIPGITWDHKFVTRRLQRVHEDGLMRSLEDKKRSGRPRLTTLDQDSLAMKLLCDSPDPEVQERKSAATGGLRDMSVKRRPSSSVREAFAISRQTWGRRRKERGFLFIPSARKSTQKMRKAHLLNRMKFSEVSQSFRRRGLPTGSLCFSRMRSGYIFIGRAVSTT